MEIDDSSWNPRFGKDNLEKVQILGSLYVLYILLSQPANLQPDFRFQVNDFSPLLISDFT